MSILRKTYRTSYTTIDNAALTDPRLTWQARGVLCYLLSKPDGWNVREAQLVKASDDQGITVVRSALACLESAGYLWRGWGRNGAGRFVRLTDLADHPAFAGREPGTKAGAVPLAESGFTDVRFSDIGESDTIVKTQGKQEEGIFLTEDSGTHEPQASATEPLTLVVPSAKPSGAFTSAVRTALVDILAGGEESLALNGRTGRDAAWVGRCLGMLGRWTTTDADAAIAWLGWWRRSEQWRFRGASPHRWPAAMAAARDAYNDRPAANGQRGPIDLNRRVDFDRPLGGSAGRSRGPIDLDRR